jgi:hypothetical protein
VIDGASVDRRTVLRGLALGAVAIAACSAGRGGPRRATTTSVPATSVPTTSTSGPPRAVPWSALAGGLAGRLVLPRQATYLSDLRLYDPRFDGTRPAAIAFCANPSDVQRCIDFARTHTLAFAARSGGHSYAGYSTSPGLVIDITAMNAVTLSGSQATIGAGARLIDVYTSLNGRGVSIPAGSCPTVGIAGLTLGGGIGVVGRQYGLTCDAMTGVQIVTADSRLVTADGGAADDLYWACRGGGGGNFGIATAFNFATFTTRDVALFTLRWPWAAAASVLPGWMTWTADAPDPLWSNCILASTATTPILQVAGIWLGPQVEVAPYLDRLVAGTGASPATRFLETIALEHAMYVEAGCAQLSESACHVTGETPQAQLGRSPSLAGSSFFDRPLSDAGVRVIVGGIEDRIDAKRPGAIGFDAYGGAINRVPATSTAFVHRSTLCCAQYSVSYPASDSAAEVAGHAAWLDGYRTAMNPYTDGGAYQNYIDPRRPDALHAYYGDNLARLQTVKQRWDPDDDFRFAQSIPLP